MYVEQIGQLMRRYCDDPNQVFLPPSLQATFLQAGYDEFCRHLPDEAREITYQPPAMTGQSTIDLNNVLFGSAPTQRRCQRITRVLQVDPTTGLLQFIIQPMSSFESLSPVLSSFSGAFLTYGGRWWLDARTLRFSAPISATIQIVYLPDQDVNWTSGLVTGSNVYVDDFSQFHDIIALLAAQSYYVADGQPNNKMDAQLARRLRDMDEFFAQTRSGQGSRYVREDDPPGWVR